VGVGKRRRVREEEVVFGERERGREREPEGAINLYVCGRVHISVCLYDSTTYSQPKHDNHYNHVNTKQKSTKYT
jgi:hypothetical protein